MAVNKKTLVKTVSAITLTAVVVAALIGLGLLFSMLSFDGWVGQVLLTCATLVAAGLLEFNAVNAITSGNKLGVFAGILICVSALLFLLLIWAGDLVATIGALYTYAVVIFSSVSIFLDIMVANYVALKKSFMFAQIIFYLLIAYITLTIDLLIFGNAVLIQYWMVFVAAIILALTFYFILKVKGKTLAQADAELKTAEGYITIKKEEYDQLKAEIERLKAIIDEKNGK